jgi:hypothetical protein
MISAFKLGASPVDPHDRHDCTMLAVLRQWPASNPRNLQTIWVRVKTALVPWIETLNRMRFMHLAVQWLTVETALIVLYPDRKLWEDSNLTISPYKNVGWICPPWMRMGECRQSSMHSHPWHYMEVSDQLHSSITLYHGKVFAMSWIRVWVGLRASLEAEEKRKVTFPCGESNHDSLVSQHVAVPTELWEHINSKNIRHPGRQQWWFSSLFNDAV